MKLIANYSLFALIATLGNIAAQDVTVSYYKGIYAIELSVLVGTGIGLIIKYVLDKHYIFKFKTHTAVHNGKTFILYTLMGILTTLIFWGFECRCCYQCIFSCYVFFYCFIGDLYHE